MWRTETRGGHSVSLVDCSGPSTLRYGSKVYIGLPFDRKLVGVIVIAVTVAVHGAIAVPINFFTANQSVQHAHVDLSNFAHKPAGFLLF